MKKTFLYIPAFLLILGCTAVENKPHQNNPNSYGETRSNEFEGEEQTLEAIKVLTPMQGENLKIDDKYDIRWDFSIDESLTIALCPKQGACKIIASEVPNTGIYNWKVEGEENKDYEIQVYPTGGRERVGRSELFRIMKQ